MAARDKYDALMQLFLQVWTGLLIVAMMMWVYLRWSYHHLVDAWQALSLAETKQEIADAWADTRRSLWRARREVLVAQREAYSDVAKPLELYVAVFVLFGVCRPEFDRRLSTARLWLITLASFILGPCHHDEYRLLPEPFRCRRLARLFCSKPGVRKVYVSIALVGKESAEFSAG